MNVGAICKPKGLEMRIGIIGSGALGSVLGGLLIEAGYDVVMVERDEEEVELVRQNGFWLEGASGDRYVKPAIIGPGGEMPMVDCAIVVVKSYDTQEAVRTLGKFLAPDGVALTLQNGTGNYDILEKEFPGRVLLGTTTMGAMTLAPGKFRHTGLGTTTFGEPDGLIRDRTVEVEKVLRGMNGGPVSVVDNALGCVWSKLIVNAAINAPATLLRLRNGDLPKTTHGLELIRDIVEECLAVVKAKNISLIFEDPVRHVIDVCQGTAMNINSMFQDIRAKRRTEIDFINGAVEREAQALGLKAPVNAVLTRMVKMLENSENLIVPD